MKTIATLFAEAAQRFGVKLSAPENSIMQDGDWWCSSTIDGRWIRGGADVFESDLDSKIEAALDEAIAAAVSR